MDKYEYRIKAEQIKKLVDEENYISAMKIADTIDWRRVKNVSMLCMVSDIYEKNEKYEESHELLLLAYDRSPIGRLMVYKLSELAIKMGDFDEAIDYYKEFVHLAPNDPSAELLKYKIYRAKGVDVKELIPILEDFKNKEYHEKWAYELARLYHEAGMCDKCIAECDDIILWFSEGKYVEKAMELKMLYRPLTERQQELYEHRNDEKTADNNDDGAGIDKTKIVVMPEDAFESDINAEDIEIKPVNFGKYDTMNLQAELAKSMQEIIDATEKETVDNMMQNLQRMVEDSPFLKMEFEDETEEDVKNTEEEVPQPYMNFSDVVASTEDISETENTNVFQEEYDGQMGLVVPEEVMVEKQITGQMCIQDVLNEWEKVKAATEYAIKEAEQKRLEEAKSKALRKAERIMAKLNSVIYEENLSAAKVNKAADILENVANNVANNTWDTQALNEIAAALEANTPDVLKIKYEQVSEASEDADSITDMSNMGKVDADVEKMQETQKIYENVQQHSIPKADQEVQKQVEAEMAAAELLAQMENGMDIDEDDDVEEILTEDDISAELENNIESALENAADQMVRKEDDDDKDAEVVDDAVKTMEKGITSDLSEGLEAIIAKELEGAEEVAATVENKKTVLTQEQQDAFSTFLAVRGVEKSLEKLFAPINEASKAGKSFEIPNIAVVGKEGSGKTTLALEVVKAIQIAQHKKSGRVAKIKAEALNRKNVEDIFSKMSGGVLIIEKAGDLTEKAIKDIMRVIHESEEEVSIVIEDEKSAIKEMLEKDLDFAAEFKNKIELPEYNNDELVEFGKAYADSMMYSIDDMAVLALYTCINNIQKEDEEPVGIEDVNDIIDEAIHHSNRKKLKKLKDIIMSKRYDEEGKVILFESDFEDMM